MSQAGSEEEQQQPKRLTIENLKTGLSQIVQTFDAQSYAFTRLTLTQLELDELIEDIRNYQHLRFVDISQNNIQDISYIFKLPYVIQLFCQQNQIQSIESLNNEEIFEYLQQVDFSTNKIKKLTPLQQRNLRRLNLNVNEINNCEEFKGHPSLQILEIRGNQLTNVNGLRDMPKLIELYLAQNQITNFNGLKNLPCLKKLHLRENKIETFDEQNLPNLPSLEYINLRSNKLASITEISKLIKFESLKKLSCQDNEPLVEQYGDKLRMEVIIVLSKLQHIDKEEITQEERDDAKAETKERKKREEEERLEKERLEAEAAQKEEEEEA